MSLSSGLKIEIDPRRLGMCIVSQDTQMVVATTTDIFVKRWAKRVIRVPTAVRMTSVDKMTGILVILDLVQCTTRKQVLGLKDTLYLVPVENWFERSKTFTYDLFCILYFVMYSHSFLLEPLTQ